MSEKGIFRGLILYVIIYILVVVIIHEFVIIPIFLHNGIIPFNIVLIEIYFVVIGFMVLIMIIRYEGGWEEMSIKEIWNKYYDLIFHVKKLTCDCAKQLDPSGESIIKLKKAKEELKKFEERNSDIIRF